MYLISHTKYNRTRVFPKIKKKEKKKLMFFTGRGDIFDVVYISSKVAGGNGSIIDIIDEVLAIYWNQEIW